MQLYKIELKSRFYGSKPLFWPSVSIDCRLILKRIKMWFFFKCKVFAQFCAKTLHLNNSKVYTNMLGLRYFWIVQQALIKLSDYEISFLYGQEDILTSIKHIFSDYRPKILFLTCGSNGAYISTDRNTYHIPCLKNINTVDTTGAGDSFCGAALSKLLDYSLDFNSLNEDSYVDILRFANAAANISTTCYGAVPSMPASETIESVLMNNSIKVTKIV